MFTHFFIVLCTSCCATHRFSLPRHFFKHVSEDHLVLYDNSNSTKPLTFDIRLRYVWGQHRLIIIDRSYPKKVLYKVICQRFDQCDILGWTRNRTNVTVIATLNTMAWHPHATQDGRGFFKKCDEADDKNKSEALLKQPLLISTKLYEEVFNVTFLPLQKKYTIAYGAHHTAAEVENYDRSTPKRDDNDDYSVQIFEDINQKVDPAVLISICISIDYIEWPHFLSST